MNIGIIGFGNLGRSLAEGLLMSSVKGGSLYICDNSPDALSIAEKEFYAHISPDANYVIKNSEVIFLTVKGHIFEELSQVIDKNALKGKTIISFMAGMSFEKIYSLIGKVTLVRAMPSLAVSSCDGVIGYTKASAEVEAIFKKLGYAFETAPENIEKVMAFSSCGLGFAAYLISAFADAGLAMGFTPETCSEIAARTFQNAVGRGAFKDTVRAVATPGGATEQGILLMDSYEVSNIIREAVQKAYDKMI